MPISSLLHRAPLSLLATGLAFAVSACAAGQLEQASIARACTEREGCGETPLPRPLAVGASTLMSVAVAREAGAPVLALRASNPEVVRVEGPILSGVGTGTTAILVENDDGVVLDFFHVSVAAPTLAMFHRRNSAVPLNERLRLAPGEAVQLDVRVYGGAQELSGSADESFEMDDERFSIHLDEQRRVTVTAPDAGEASLTFESLDVSATLTLAVIP